MRGKVFFASVCVDLAGITPAYAGKSLPSLSFAHTYWDHPRVCGEKDFVIIFVYSFSGSPPRMRGKGCRNHPVILVNGITPAYAGKSMSLKPGLGDA